MVENEASFYLHYESQGVDSVLLSSEFQDACRRLKSSLNTILINFNIACDIVINY